MNKLSEGRIQTSCIDNRYTSKLVSCNIHLVDNTASVPQPKVFIGDHEITDYESFMKVAFENEELRKRNKELEEGFKAINEELCDTTSELEKTKSIIKEIREYIKENEKEYGSLEDNEKIILKIIDEGE